MTHLIPLADALDPIRDVYRHLLSAAVTWQADRPRRTDPDLFALICVAADAAPDPPGPACCADPRHGPGSGCGRTVAPVRWTRTGVYRALRCDIPRWCSLHSCLWPVELVEAMWEWFDFLHGTGRLHPRSDPLWELRKPLLCHGGLDHHGRLRTDDSARAPSGRTSSSASATCRTGRPRGCSTCSGCSASTAGRPRWTCCGPWSTTSRRG